jgi:hypothetical protein
MFPLGRFPSSNHDEHLLYCTLTSIPRFLQHLVEYLETNPDRNDKAWGWMYVSLLQSGLYGSRCLFRYCAGLFFFNALNYSKHDKGNTDVHRPLPDFAIFEVMTGQLWSIATTRLQVALKVELNTILFAKTLLRKDVATSSSSIVRSDENEDEEEPAPLDVEASAIIRTEDAIPGTISGSNPDADFQLKEDSKQPEKVGDDKNDFSSKSQIMTLMTTDVGSDN